MKKCTKCRNYKPLNQFYFRNKKLGKLHAVCKMCTDQINTLWNKENPDKKAVIARRHYDKSAKEVNLSTTTKRRGLTVEWYYTQLAAQEGKCAICGSVDSGTKHGNFCIDHNHNDNQNRGLLCRSCNTGIARFKENEQFFQSAITYLRKWRN